MAPPPPTRAPERGLVAWVIVAGLAVRAAVAAVVPITTDEAYYVDWARHLASGYLDHPPLVAWLVAGPLRIAGASTLAIRVPALLLQAGTTWLAASLVASWAGQRAAVVAALLLQVAPVFSLGAVLATPDAPLACAWVGALWALDRATGEGVRRGPAWFLAAGAFVGVGASSKLTAGVLAVALVAATVATPDGRRALRTPWPWGGALLAVALASPMLAWNAAHGWPSFRFQARHGLAGGGFSALLLARSIGAQLAYVSPVLLVVAAAAGWRGLRDGRAHGAARLATALSALPVVALFTLAAARTPGALPHWPAPGWLSAVLLLAVAGTRWLRAAAWTGGLLCAVLVAAAAVPLPVATPLDELRGWCDAVAAARRVDPAARLATTHWIALGHLGWCAREPLAYVSDRPSAATYYAIDPDPRRLLVVVPVGLGPPRDLLERLLGPLEDLGGVEATRGGRTIRSYRLYRPLADGAPRSSSTATMGSNSGDASPAHHERSTTSGGR